MEHVSNITYTKETATSPEYHIGQEVYVLDYCDDGDFFATPVTIAAMRSEALEDTNGKLTHYIEYQIAYDEHDKEEEWYGEWLLYRSKEEVRSTLIAIHNNSLENLDK